MKKIGRWVAHKFKTELLRVIAFSFPLALVGLANSGIVSGRIAWRVFWVVVLIMTLLYIVETMDLFWMKIERVCLSFFAGSGLAFCLLFFLALNSKEFREAGARAEERRQAVIESGTLLDSEDVRIVGGKIETPPERIPLSKGLLMVRVVTSTDLDIQSPRAVVVSDLCGSRLEVGEKVEVVIRRMRADEYGGNAVPGAISGMIISHIKCE